MRRGVLLGLLLAWALRLWLEPRWRAFWEYHYEVSADLRLRSY